MDTNDAKLLKGIALVRSDRELLVTKSREYLQLCQLWHGIFEFEFEFELS